MTLSGSDWMNSMKRSQIVPDPQWIKYYLKDSADPLHRLLVHMARPGSQDGLMCTKQFYP